MKRPNSLVRDASDTDMNNAMTPMIDVVFLLLVFFVWTASFQVVEFVLPSEMSAQLGNSDQQPADPPPPDDFEDIVVRLIGDGQQSQWLVNQQPAASLEVVGQQLQAIAAIGADSTVILHPDPQIPVGVAIETYDTIKRAGFSKVSFAVNP